MPCRVQLKVVVLCILSLNRSRSDVRRCPGATTSQAQDVTGSAAPRACCALASRLVTRQQRCRHVWQSASEPAIARRPRLLRADYVWTALLQACCLLAEVQRSRQRRACSAQAPPWLTGFLARARCLCSSRRWRIGQTSRRASRCCTLQLVRWRRGLLPCFRTTTCLAGLQALPRKNWHRARRSDVSP